jgi:hypothetical protein
MKVEPPHEARGSTEEEPAKGQIPIYRVPIIWEPCVLKWKNTKIACKVKGYKDPKRPRSVFLADCEGVDTLTASDKKWLANFLVRVPPDTTWGKVQVLVKFHQPPPLTDGTVTTKAISRWNWTGAWGLLSCRRREERQASAGRDENRGIGRNGNANTTDCPHHHPLPNGDHRRTPDTCGLNGIRIGEAKNPGPGSESQSSTSVLEQGETTRGHGSTTGGKIPTIKEKEVRRASPPERKGRKHRRTRTLKRKDPKSSPFQRKH